jgi:hypothetical protein
MVREAALAQHPRERSKWLAVLDGGAPIHLALFDEHGFARIGFGESDGAVDVVGRASWRSFCRFKVWAIGTESPLAEAATPNTGGRVPGGVAGFCSSTELSLRFG